jgi:hypothetical protein
MTIGDFVRRLLCRQSGGCEPRDDYIDLETDQLGGQFGKPVEVSFSRSKLKSNVLPLDIPQIAQPLPKLPPKLFRTDIANDQCADGRHLRLLREGRERQYGRCAAEQRDELPSPYVEHGLPSRLPSALTSPATGLLCLLCKPGVLDSLILAVSR